MFLEGTICTSVDCADGKAGVEAMDSVFQGLPKELQTQFHSAYTSIMEAFYESYSWYDQLPVIGGGFSTSCCTVHDIGIQAEALTLKMQKAAGVQTSGDGPATNNPSGFGLGLDLGLGSIAAIVIGLVILTRR